MVIGLLLIGVPIAISLGFSSIIFLLVLSDTSLASIAQTMFQAMAGHYTLLAIPFFILASSASCRRVVWQNGSSGSRSPSWGTSRVVWPLRACLPVCCSPRSRVRRPATVVAIGSIVIAGMRQVGYSKDFAAGVIANAGTLGILIPPSIVMVVYASATDVSVGRMFLAGVIPGLMAGSMLMVTIYVDRACEELAERRMAGLG